MSTSSSSNNQIAKATGLIMAAFILSQLVGLFRRILVANAFGASIELDAFIAANRVSETLFNLVAGGALGSAFIPVYTKYLVKGNKKSAWELASSIGNLVLLVLTLLAVISFFFAPQIVKFALAPGLASDPSLFQLTIKLLRIQLISSILFGISGLFMGILNSHKQFLIPALTPAMYQVGLIFGVYLLSPSMGIFGLAWGVVLGALLHLILQIPSIIKKVGRYSFSLGIKNKDVGEVIRLIVPRLLGVAVVQLNFWVNSALASKMSAGSLVGIDYGFSLMLMAQAIIAQSAATAMMPTLTRQYALGKMNEVRNSLSSTLRGILLLSIPASVGLIILARPLITTLYQRGNFTEHSTELVAWALVWYSGGLIGHALVEVLARAFYALHNTKTPVIIGVFAMILNIILSFSLSSLFSKLGLMPHGGLALANSIATLLEAIILLILIRKRLQGVNSIWILRGFMQSALASACMGLLLFAFLNWFTGTADWILLGSGLIVGGGSYLIIIWLMKNPELLSFFRLIKERFSS
ncbi:murein biosynthesis integral membrane protein MurJ [Chloroflexota bacterium]